MLKGIILSYRRGRHKIYPKQVIVKFENINSREEASKLIGKRAIWISYGKKKIFIGKVFRVHGNKGRVLIRFKKGIPGQAIGDIVILVNNIEEIKNLKEKLKEAKDINQIRKILMNV